MDTIIENLTNINSDIDKQIEFIKSIRKFIRDDKQRNKEIIASNKIQITYLRSNIDLLNKKLKKCNDIEAKNRKFEMYFGNNEKELKLLNLRLDDQREDLLKQMEDSKNEIAQLQNNNQKLKLENDNLIRQMKEIQPLSVPRPVKRVKSVHQSTKPTPQQAKNFENLINTINSKNMKEILNLNLNNKDLNPVHKKQLQGRLNEILNEYYGFDFLNRTEKQKYEAAQVKLGIVLNSATNRKNNFNDFVNGPEYNRLKIYRDAAIKNYENYTKNKNNIYILKDLMIALKDDKSPEIAPTTALDSTESLEDESSEII